MPNSAATFALDSRERLATASTSTSGCSRSAGRCSARALRPAPMNPNRSFLTFPAFSPWSTARQRRLQPASRIETVAPHGGWIPETAHACRPTRDSRRCGSCQRFSRLAAKAAVTRDAPLRRCPRSPNTPQTSNEAEERPSVARDHATDRPQLQRPASGVGLAVPVLGSQGPHRDAAPSHPHSLRINDDAKHERHETSKPTRWVRSRRRERRDPA